MLDARLGEGIDELADGGAHRRMFGFETQSELFQSIRQRRFAVDVVTAARRGAEQTREVIEQQQERLSRTGIERAAVEPFEAFMQGENVLLGVLSHCKPSDGRGEC